MQPGRSTTPFRSTRSSKRSRVAFEDGASKMTELRDSFIKGNKRHP
jgi:hypothetical protein